MCVICWTYYVLRQCGGFLIVYLIFSAYCEGNTKQQTTTINNENKTSKRVVRILYLIQVSFAVASLLVLSVVFDAFCFLCFERHNNQQQSAIIYNNNTKTTQQQTQK
jgi:hypothetical protein